METPVPSQTTADSVAPGTLSMTSVSAALLLLEPAEASEPSSVLRSYLSDSSKNQAPGSLQVFWIQRCLGQHGTPARLWLQPEDEADSDRAGWCNRASHSGTGRPETGTRASACQGLALREPSKGK